MEYRDSRKTLTSTSKRLTPPRSPSSAQHEGEAQTCDIQFIKSCNCEGSCPASWRADIALTDRAKEDCKTPSWICPQPSRELEQASVTAPALFGDGFETTGQAQDTKSWSPLPGPFSFPHTQTEPKLDTTYAVFVPPQSWGSSWWAVGSTGGMCPWDEM